MMNDAKREKAFLKELQTVQKNEKRLAQAALKAKSAVWKEEVEKRIPAKVYSGLESAFCKGFSVVFSQGKAIIEKGFNKEEIRADHAIRDYAVQMKGGRKELKQIRKNAQQSELINLTATTVEGIGLGIFGIGMPDIVLFLGILLKGIYEMALNYGFDYESKQEQMFILKMMSTALSSGQEWVEKNKEVEEMMQLETVEITDEDLQQQTKETSSIFAMDMLLLKWIQGLPVVGIMGGAANPVYYSKVMKYIELKYRKRYLMKQRGGIENV